MSGSRGERGCLVSSFSTSLLSAGVGGEKKRGSVETGRNSGRDRRRVYYLGKKGVWMEWWMKTETGGCNEEVW